jgi:hypothetical protein
MFLDLDIVTIYLLQKGFMEKYIWWYIHGEPYVPHDTMVERMIGSTSSSSNVHGVVDDNSNPYRNMVLDMMRIKVMTVNVQYEEPKANMTMFFDLLKHSDEPLWDDCTNHNKLYRLLHMCSPSS